MSSAPLCLTLVSKNYVPVALRVSRRYWPAVGIGASGGGKEPGFRSRARSRRSVADGDEAGEA